MIGGFLGGGRAAAAKPGFEARRLATEAVRAVLRARKPFDNAFAERAASPDFAGLPPRDAAFARAIAAAALRRCGQIAGVLRHFIERPPAPPKGAFDDIMLTACAQLLFLDAPAHAVIDIAVDQLKADREARRLAKLANAVLRRVAAEGPALLAAQDAERLNTPGWLWRRWACTYGEDVARAIAAQHLRQPPLDLAVKADAPAWAARLGGVAPLGNTVRLHHRGRIEEIEGYDDGAWWVQDAAAALPARLLGDVAGKRVADLCAAPGGKTAQLAAAGARVTAVDHSRARLERLRANLRRLRLDADIVEADAGSWRGGEAFDAVLLDAPCSATGTIRRNPDIPQLKAEAQIAALARAQARLIDHAASLVAPGGALVYCVCSLEDEEGPGQIAAFLSRRPEMALDKATPDEIGGRGEWITPDGCLRTLPHFLALSDPDLSGMDGFFAARLRRRAD